MKSLFLLFAFAAPAFAATTYILPGTSDYGVWNLSNANYNASSTPSAYPTTRGTSASWGGPIASSGGSSATFTRLSGIGYFISSGSGIYGTEVAGSYGISDLEPMENMANLIFQARLNLAPASLTLYLNDSSQAIAPTFSLVTDAGTDIDDYAWQWDLTSYAGTINSYQIVLSANPHTVVYGNAPGLTTIASSTSFAQAIPEPSAALLGLAALGFAGLRRRRA